MNFLKDKKHKYWKCHILTEKKHQRRRLLEIRSLLAHVARASERYIAISKAHHDIAPVLQAAGSGKGAWLQFAITLEPPQNSIGTIVSTFPLAVALVSSLSYSTQVNAAKIIVGFWAPPP